MAIFVVLLRAIGPITHKIMSMAQWREAVANAGFEAPETYVATGNMIMEGSGTLASVTRQMNEIAVGLGLGAGNRAVVRAPGQLAALVRANPLPEAASTRPSQMGVYFFASAAPDFSWIGDYQGPENIRIEGKHLIVDYNGGVANSKLPGLIEKRSGTATARNWNTLRGLHERAAARRNKQGH